MTRCECPLHVIAEVACPNESAVGCYVCGTKLCLDCTKAVLIRDGWVRICQPTAADTLCLKAIGYRDAYAQAAAQ